MTSNPDSRPEPVPQPSWTQPSRRAFLGGAAIGTVGVLGTVYAGGAAAAPAPPSEVFRHGIASGDPLPDRVILWTRVTPTADATAGSGRGGATTIRWEVATDPGFGSVVSSGTTTTDAGSDLTVKVDAGGLSPNTGYHYRFHVVDGPAAGTVSPVGRTKTAPDTAAEVARVRFGVVSCANWEAGYFGAYRHLAAQPDLDAIVHLGDYIYEYGIGEYTGKNGPVRRHEPAHEIISVADYRIRHAQYKTDPDLQLAHRDLPWICTWDDHEAANDAWASGAENHSAAEGDWPARKAAAEQAYYEWMPVRPVPDAGGRHLYRRLRYGNLLELSMLDLRTYRTEQPGTTSNAADNPAATITGAAQMSWLTNGVVSSPTRWKIVGNPVMISPILIPPLEPRTTAALTDLLGVPSAGIPLSSDPWDGYTADRRRLYQALRDNNIQNTVFITGDIHMSFACDLPNDPANYPGAGTVGTELVTPSVTSSNVDDLVGAPEYTVGNVAAAALTNVNRHLRWVDTDAHGYAVLTVTDAATQMDWYFVNNRDDPRSGQRYGQSWRVPNGSQKVVQVGRAAG
ncbi:alkaline phosphatase D family protein [Gordonia rubripertincta]|uniref:Alkaline phosphatase D family protein n=1 Tax=Gordonia rubripertincta TaxID=36822 RepID=A0ABT4MYD1_GORRU|nr:alkaline phosphatase D family protein [Gordonia rubripertincta]MCZ4552017.1 alkaline phosphatase D family protein [Gordonia rubripertincta]